MPKEGQRDDAAISPHAARSKPNVRALLRPWNPPVVVGQQRAVELVLSQLTIRVGEDGVVRRHCRLNPVDVAAVNVPLVAVSVQPVAAVLDLSP